MIGEKRRHEQLLQKRNGGNGMKLTLKNLSMAIMMSTIAWEAVQWRRTATKK